jgi:hypothetical protein
MSAAGADFSNAADETALNEAIRAYDEGLLLGKAATMIQYGGGLKQSSS